jgi:hypothetical protein
MVLEDVEDPSCDGLMGLKKISTRSVLETGKISPLTVPDGGVVLSRPRPTLGCKGGGISLPVQQTVSLSRRALLHGSSKGCTV